MKKVFSILFVALCAAFTLISCGNNDPLSDTELTAKIQQYADYDCKAKINDETIALYFKVVADRYVIANAKFTIAEFDALYEDYAADPEEADAWFAGHWSVALGELLLVDLDGNTYQGKVSDDAKKITFYRNDGSEYFTLTK
ncbi:MAG: hypothetical protein LBS50_07325 [Prevotellaceae bacterium]|jgi:predicted small lipoprotein YifL|nr:hypothetical protein [Prevotellaceae bacterium]